MVIYPTCFSFNDEGDSSRERKISAIEVMEVVTVLYELLFTVLAGVDRWPEIPNLRGLESWTERAECSIDIPCPGPYRAVILAIDVFDSIPSREHHAGRMTGESLYEHAETGEEKF